MFTRVLDMAETTNAEMIDDFLVNAAWALHSTYHTVLKSTPGAAVFGRDMLFDIPYIADWTTIGQRRQLSVDKDNARENTGRIDFDYAVGHKVMIRKDGHIRKAEDIYLGPLGFNAEPCQNASTSGELRRFLSEQTISLLKRNMLLYY